MEQMTIPGLEPRPPSPGSGAPVGEAHKPPAPDADERQLDLFADRAALERDLDQALRSGDFDTACRLRDVHRETYGATSATASLDFLEALAALDPPGDPGRALRTWESADEGLRDQAALRHLVREGFLRRLLASHAGADLVALYPPCLGAVVGFLTREARAAGGDAAPEARRLVRDALLSGRSLEPLEVEEDPHLSDLLAEGWSPPWLACLGAVRRLWPVPAATPDELRAFAGGGDTEGDEALLFWRCLQAAEAPGCPEHLRHEARRRMKRLRPELHALYMRRARPTP
jgi:hypothetical protein